MRDQAVNFIDPTELARITDLDLLARTAVQSLHSGMHRSVQTGSSAEFAQYRPYTQGDDPRWVDWRLYGRTDRLHVKEFENESSMHCTILLDCSASMDYGSGSLLKFRYAQMLAASLVLLLARQRDSVGLIGYHNEICVQMPPRRQTNHARRILVEIQNARPAGATDTAGALSYIGNLLPARGMIVLISDLIHPLDEMINHLRSLRARRHDVLVLQIADPAELTFPFDKNVTLLDTEDGREQYLAPAEVREAYLANRNDHFSRIRHECLAAEIDIEEFLTNEPLDRALHHFIHRRNHALMTASGRRSTPGRGGH